MTFIAGFENIAAVRRSSSPRKAQQNMQTSLPLVEECHVTAWAPTKLIRSPSAGYTVDGYVSNDLTLYFIDAVS